MTTPPSRNPKKVKMDGPCNPTRLQAKENEARRTTSLHRVSMASACHGSLFLPPMARLGVAHLDQTKPLAGMPRKRGCGHICWVIFRCGFFHGEPSHKPIRFPEIPANFFSQKLASPWVHLSRASWDQIKKWLPWGNRRNRVGVPFCSPSLT